MLGQPTLVVAALPPATFWCVLMLCLPAPVTPLPPGLPSAETLCADYEAGNEGQITHCLVRPCIVPASRSGCCTAHSSTCPAAAVCSPPPVCCPPLPACPCLPACVPADCATRAGQLLLPGAAAADRGGAQRRRAPGPPPLPRLLSRHPPLLQGYRARWVRRGLVLMVLDGFGFCWLV